MTAKHVSILAVFLCFLTAKIFSEKIFKAHKTVPPNLKAVEASYEGKSLKQYSLGFDNLLASLLWVEVLQLAEHTPLKGDEVSWEYAQLDAITTLDPKFTDAYKYGSIILSTFRRDKLGGLSLLEKWSKRDPTYWRPVYTLGMHYFQEIGDYEKAAPLVLRASTMNGAPYWVSSLGLRLLSDSGSLLSAIATAIEVSKFTKGELGIKYLTERIRSIVFNLQKNEWNNALLEYRKKLKQDPSTLRELAAFNSHSSRETASLHSFKEDEVPEVIQDALKEVFAFRIDNKLKKIVAEDAAIEVALGKTGVYVPKASAPRIK